MIDYNLTYKRYGERSILIEWPAIIDENIIRDVIAFEHIISKQQKVISTTIAYHSILVNYQSLYNYSSDYKYKNSFQKAVENLKILYDKREVKSNKTNKIWQVPVCYDVKFGWDLEELSREKEMTISELVDLHTKQEYLVYFIGFQPGFLYLGGLNTRLHHPRKATPRIKVEKGSVGIGGEQTGVYPHDSSGGWNIIGKSPLTFFNPAKNTPCFAQSGDRIQFAEITLSEFDQIKKAIQKDEYKPTYVIR